MYGLWAAWESRNVLVSKSARSRDFRQIYVGVQKEFQFFRFLGVCFQIYNNDFMHVAKYRQNKKWDQK